MASVFRNSSWNSTSGWHVMLLLTVICNLMMEWRWVWEGYLEWQSTDSCLKHLFSFSTIAAEQWKSVVWEVFAIVAGAMGNSIMSLQFYMHPPHVMCPGMFLSCSSVRASRNIVKTISWEVFDRFSPNWFIIMKASNWGHVGIKCTVNCNVHQVKSFILG